MKFSVSKKTQRQASIAVVAGIAIVGAASLLFKTYPHLNPFCKSASEEEKVEKEEQEPEAEEESAAESAELLEAAQDASV